MTGPQIEPHMLAMIDQTAAARRPHVDALLDAAQRHIESHGELAEATLAYALGESKHYPYDVACALVAYFAIEEAKRRAVSDVD